MSPARATAAVQDRAFAPPVVHAVLRQPGRPLDAPVRERLAPRFPHDLSRVRVHADRQAAASADAVGALAYAVGHHVVFAQGRYDPASGEGGRLLAHELAHVAQQGAAPAALPARIPIGPAHDPAEADADRVAARALGGAPAGVPAAASTGLRLQRQPAPGRATTRLAFGTGPPRPPPRGPNPADGLDALCRELDATPASQMSFPAASDAWRDRAVQVVDAGAAASNASHHEAIAASNRSDAQAEALRFHDPIRQFHPPDAEADKAALLAACRRRAREVRIEFHHNLVFAQGTRDARTWGTDPAEWDAVERALEAFPDEMLWGGALAITLRREGCSPSDLTAGGACGHTIGGATHRQGDQASINVFDFGMAQGTYGNAPNLGIENAVAVLRHELGHAFVPVRIDQPHRLRDDVMGWRLFYLPWILQPPPDRADAQRQQTEALSALGMDLAQFRTFVDAANPNPWTRQVRGDLTFERRYRPGATGNDCMLHFYRTAQMPTLVDFQYARDDPSEYAAEIVMLALSRPAWLHDVLPPEQVEWLKTDVFRTPDPSSVARELAVAPETLTRFLFAARRAFTRRQMLEIATSVTTEAAAGGAVA